MSNGVILYIGGFELPDKNAAAHRVLSNAKILRNLGKKVVLVGVDKLLDAQSSVLSTHSEIQGFDVFSVPYPCGNISWIKYLISIKKYIEVCESIENIEMVILYNFQSIAMHRLMRFCKKKSIKCCGDVTEWRSAKGEHLLYRLLKDIDTWYRMRILHKQMDGLIVISSYLETYYHNCKKVVKIPALVDCDEKKWVNDCVKSKEELHLVYAGNPGRKDRLDKLIEALYDMKKCQLDIIGITAEQYLKYYPAHKDLIKNNKNIWFHGRLSHLETLQFVKHANYSCFLRVDDRVSKAGFPTKFVEAISCGTPVVTNKTSNLVDFSLQGRNVVLIDSFSAQNLRSVLDGLPYSIPVDKKIFDYRNYVEEMSRLLYD